MAGGKPCLCLLGIGSQGTTRFAPRRAMRSTIGRMTNTRTTPRSSLCGCGRPNDSGRAERSTAAYKPKRTQQSARRQLSVACYAQLAVSEMRVLELKDELRARGYPISGNKTALQDRLLEALRDEEQLSASAVKQPEGSPQDSSPQSAPGTDNFISVEDQLQFDRQHQQQRQQEQGLGELAPDSLPVRGQHGDVTEPVSGQNPESVVNQKSVPHGSRKQGWASLTAERLRNQLRYRGLPTNGAKSVLVDRITQAAGPEVIEMAEPEGVTDAALDEASHADALTDDTTAASTSDAADLSSYKASELKSELERLGLPSTGSRQALENRLMDYYQSSQDDQYEQLAQQVEGMSSAELQQELLARGAAIQGLTKIELQDMLWATLQAEAGLLPPQDQAQGAADGELQEQLQFSNLEADPQIQDSPLMVALLCGGPTSGQQQSFSSAQMLMQQLQTHNPREGFQGDPAAPSASSSSPADPNSSPSSSPSNTSSDSASTYTFPPELPTARREDLTGTHFVPVFITSDQHAMPITAAELCGKDPAMLQSEAGARQRQVVSLQQLGQQLQGIADMALSTVQGTGAGAVQSALQAAGVPVVGPPSHVHDIAVDRYRRHNQLVELGYPSLPMCQLNKSLFATHDTTINQTPAALSARDSNPPQGSSSLEASPGRADQAGVQEEQWEEEEQADSQVAPEWQTMLDSWLAEHGLSLDHTTLVVKPVAASHYHEAWLVNSHEMLQQRAEYIFSQGTADAIIVEEYRSPKDFTEFGVTVLGTAKGPVALLPTEISSFNMTADIAEAELDNEAYQARQEGYEQQVIDVMLDAYRQEQLVNVSDALDMPLISPFQPDQPLQRESRYHTPPRFSKEVVEGIRHAAGKLFKDLGLQDIAFIKGWVKTDLPDDELKLTSSSASAAKQIPTSPFASTTEALDTAEQRWAENTEGIERLPFDLNNFHISPRATLAVPSLNTEPVVDDDEDNDDTYDLEQGSQAAIGMHLASHDNVQTGTADLGLNSELQQQQLSESEHVDSQQSVAPESFDDAEEEDEDLLSTLFYNDDPSQLCMHGPSTIIFSGLDTVPSLHPTSVVFQQAADVGISHCALLRHVLSSACQRAGLPAVPSVTPHDITDTALVPYGQVRPLGHEGLVDFGGAAMQQGWQIYANPPNLAGPTPSGRIETMRMPEEPAVSADPWDQATPNAGAQFGQQWDEQQYGTAQPAYQYGNSADYAQGYDAAGGYGQPGYPAPAGPSKVWVLMGGEGAQRQNSLRSGLHVWLMLQNNPELQVEPFLLAPLGSNTREQDRRKELLRQRNNQLRLGLAEHELDQPLQLPHIRNPDPPQHSLLGRAVWAVPHAMLLRDTVEHVHAACEMALAPVNAVHRTLTAAEQNVTEIRQAVQQMLQYAEVEGAGSLWGHDTSMMHQPPPPRYMDLQSFAEEAHLEGAVVLNAVQAEVGDDGFLQSYLEDADVQVAHTGSDATATKLCHDKIAMSEHLKTLEVYHISTIPKRRLTKNRLLSVLQDADAVDNLFQDLRSSLGDSPELCVKPALGGLLPNQALPCLASSADLGLFGVALEERVQQLPADYLSTPHPPIPLPPANTLEFMVEPYIHAARLVRKGVEASSGQEIAWVGDSRWIPISAALLGEVGRMQVLTPSVLVHPAADSTSQGQAVQVTPPPADFLPSDVIDSAKHWMTLAADRLAIAGAAQMDVFVHADKGEIIIIDVHTVPDLSQNSLLLQQALVEDPPVHPADVLREIVDLGQLPLQPVGYEDANFEPQDNLDPSDVDDPIDATGLDEDMDVEGQQQVDEQAQTPSQQLQAASGSGEVGAGWTDDSFTDSAIDESDFDAGFDVVEQNQYL